VRKALIRLTKEDPKCVVDMAVKASVDNVSPSNDYSLFTLAYVISNGDVEGRRYAASKVNSVARTGTHLFTFVHYVTQDRGWGKILRDTVADWYTSKTPNSLAYQILKYRQRSTGSGEDNQSYSHRDLLRLSHVKDDNMHRRMIYHYITKGVSYDSDSYSMDIARVGTRECPELKLPINPHMFEDGPADMVYAVEATKVAKTEKEIIGLIERYGLTHEMIPNEFKNSKDVWAALLVKMPVTATMRNLAKMTAVGLLEAGNWDTIKMVRDKLDNQQALIKARVHPLNVLKAVKTYNMGQGFRGSLKWTPVSDIKEILEGALFKSFGAVPITNKRYILGVDVSGSMSGFGYDNGSHPMSPLTPAEIAMTMAWITYKLEPMALIIPFADQCRPFDMSRFTSLYDFLAKTRSMNFGGTDCALPVLIAEKNKIAVDMIGIFTDSETWAGKIHPFQALKSYRQTMGLDPGFAVVGITSNGFTIADPTDPKMVDIVGFDPGAPRIISALATGELSYNEDAIRTVGGNAVEDVPQSSDGE
jgi:60 kDa SS-A/Ro ribonucleoprotein